MRKVEISIVALFLLTAFVATASLAQGIDFWFARQGDVSGTSISSLEVVAGSNFSVSLWYQTAGAWPHNALEILVGFDRTNGFGRSAVPLDNKITYVSATNSSFPIILASNTGGGYSSLGGVRPYGAHIALGAALGTTVTASAKKRIIDVTLKNAAIPLGSYYDLVIYDAAAGSRWTSFAAMRHDIRREAQQATLRILSVDGTPPPEYTIPEWKALGNGERGKLVGYEVTLDVGPDFFVQEADSSAGIRVAKTDPGTAIPRGSRATIVGTIRTNANGERYISASSIETQSNTVTISSLGMTCRSLGGSDWRYNPATGAGQVGVKDGFGTNNVGLLVRVWGAPILTGDAASFKIDDGSGMDVLVKLPSGQTHPWNSGNLPGYVSVTGASGLVKHADSTYTSAVYISSFSTDVRVHVP